MKRAFCFYAAAAAWVLVAPTVRAQVRTAGYIDTNFFANCFGSTSPRALAIQFDGRIIAGGNFTAPGFACVNAIDRLNANGLADMTFNSPFLAGHVVNALAIQGNKIIVAGAMGNSVSTFPLARLNASGSIDDSFQRPIQNIAVVFNALLIQPDGKIVAGGDANSGPGVTFGYLARVTANGAQDLNFAGGPVTSAAASLPVIAALAYAGGGNVLVGGSFTSYRNVSRPGLVRIDSTGAVDPGYLPDIADGAVSALLVQPDGKALVAGNFTAGGLGSRALVRLNSDGTLDGTFQPLNGMGTIGLSLALQPDGKVILGHSFGVMRLATNGVPDATFGPRNAFAQLGTDADNVTALALAADTNLIVGAARVTVAPAERHGVARLFAFVPPLPPPPVIVEQPLTQIVDAGTNVTFSVMATGAPPLSYQWRKDGARIKNATNDTLALSDVNSTHIGNYSVIVANPGGAVTSAVARLVVNFNTSQLVLMTNGVGAILPNLAGKELEIGRAYMLTAKPAVGNLFSNWTGGVTSSSPALTFVMQSNLVLVANFVPSPFRPIKGVYTGLFFDTNAPAHENAGFVSLQLDDKGGYKGSVRMGARLRKFAGTFALDLTSRLAVASVATTPALDLMLRLDVNNAALTGFGSNSFGNITFAARLNPFSSAANPAPGAGLYNAALPGVPATTIEGDGIATVTVSTSGRVSARGSLADGTGFQLRSATAGDASVPVYAPLYRGQGSLFGWITVTNSGVNDVAGLLWWFKPASAGGLNDPGGVARAIPVMGSRYVSPSPRTPVLNLIDGVLVLSGGNLPEPITNSITLGGDNKITGDNRLTLTFSPSKGSIAGTFVDPSSGKKRKVKGVALQAEEQGRGFFLGTDASGRILVSNRPQ